MKSAFARCLLMLVCLAMGLGACGASAAEGYTVVLPPQYDGAGHFTEGLAAVMIGEKWGFIDKTGKAVVPPQYNAPWCYDDVLDFHDGLAGVMVRDGETEKWGFIDRTGREVVPPRYDEVRDFREGLAAVMMDGKWGFIDRAGQEVVPPRYDYEGSFSGDIEGFHDGLAMVMIGDANHPNVWDVFDGQKWGYIDKTGREAVPVEYDKIGEFHEGRACVIKDGKLGFVDKTGAVVIPLAYESPYPSFEAWHQDVMPFFSEGLAAVWGGDAHNGQYGYLDEEGNVAIPFSFDYAAPFSEGLAYVSKGASLWYETNVNGKFGYINKEGQEVVPLVYDCSYVGHGILFDWHFTDGLAQVSQKGASPWEAKYGLVDQTGKIAVPIRYHWLRRLAGGLSFAGYGEDFSGHGTWDSIGLIDETGAEIVAIDYYAWIGNFSEGYAWVRDGSEGGVWMEDDESTYGFIDMAGNEVVPCIFQAVGDFSEGLAAVLADGKWGYIAIAK